MPIFHPLAQCGVGGQIRANWHRYDVGVVSEVSPDPNFDAGWRCRFIIGDLTSQGSLSYDPTNLWVPKPLAGLLDKDPHGLYFDADGEGTLNVDSFEGQS